MIQGSKEWLSARVGKATASRSYEIMPGKNGYRASRKNYLAELVCGRLTGLPQESFTSAAMQWGTDTEPLARSAYEAITGNMVEEVGFIHHGTIEMFGASPDGLVSCDGGIEIKCPNTATHIQTLLYGTIKPEYKIQMQTCMACTGRSWWDFMSYDPRLDDKNSYKIIRVERDEKVIIDIEAEVVKFLGEVDEMMEKLI